MVKTTSVSGSITTFSYTTHQPRLETIIDPCGGRTTYAYEGALNKKIKSITDPAGRVTEFKVDSNNNLIKFTSPELCVTSLTYDGEHRITSITDPEGNRYTFGYDSSSKLDEIRRSEREAKPPIAMTVRSR